jgi:hypothetical protein
MFYFDTGSDDDDFGYMYCEWDENPALMMIRRHIETAIRGLGEGLKQINSVESVRSPSETEIQTLLDEMSVKALALLKEYALVMFRQTQGQLVCDVTLKVMEAMMREVNTQPIHEGQKLPPFSLAELEGTQAIKDVRKSMSQFFKTKHNEIIGIKRGREAQVSIDKIIECLRRLPKGVGLARLASEMDLSPRTIQYALKAAGLTFPAAKRKAQE